MRSVLGFLGVVTALSVATGAIFSLLNWGYPWSLPAPDARARDVRWSALSGFRSAPTGAEWTWDASDVHRSSEHASDAEFCPVARLVTVADSSKFVELTQPEISGLEAEALSLVELETGAPGYDFAKRISGAVALGTDNQGRATAFASFVGGEVSNDHHAIYEVLWLRSTPPRLISSRKYYEDVAGLEGLTAPMMAMTLVVPFAMLALFVVQLWRARESALSRRTE